MCLHATYICRNEFWKLGSNVYFIHDIYCFTLRILATYRYSRGAAMVYACTYCSIIWCVMVYVYILGYVINEKWKNAD